MSSVMKKSVDVMKRKKKNVQRIDHDGTAQKASDHVDRPMIYMCAYEFIGIILPLAVPGRSSSVKRGFSEGVQDKVFRFVVEPTEQGLCLCLSPSA